MLAVFADAKLGGLVPAFEIAVGEDREILELAVARLAFFGAAEDFETLAKCVGTVEQINANKQPIIVPGKMFFEVT